MCMCLCFVRVVLLCVIFFVKNNCKRWINKVNMVIFIADIVFEKERKSHQTGPRGANFGSSGALGALSGLKRSPERGLGRPSGGKERLRGRKK